MSHVPFVRSALAYPTVRKTVTAAALEHAKALPALETEIRQQLRSGLDFVWSEASADLDNTVLGPVHHISSNIEVGLLFPQVD
jgi:hypothetical protein